MLMEQKIKNKKILWLTIALVVIFSVTVIVFMFMFKKNSNKQENASPIAYTVTGVPYFGIYNRTGKDSGGSGYAGGDFGASFLEVLEYWNPGQSDFNSTYYNLNKNIFDHSGFNTVSLSGLSDTFSKVGFNVKTVKLNISDLKNYINPEAMTPLILFLPISSNQPESIAFYPASTLIGIDENGQKLILHNFWLGNNYEISFDEFGKLQNRLPQDSQNMYLVVQPKNLDEKLKEVSGRKTSNYPMRTSIMQQGEQMFKDYAIGSAGAYHLGLWPQAMEYISKVENSPNFTEFFPPYYKTMLYYQKANMFFLKNDLDNALIYANKAVAIDYDLDKPFKDWIGFEIAYVRPDQRGTAPEPYIVLGDVLDKRGDLQGALAAYKKASSLLLSSGKVDANIKNVELEMARKGITE